MRRISFDNMAQLLLLKAGEASGRLQEIRRFQVYRLGRRRHRSLLERLRRTLRARLHR
jgi:hypothetical protein